MPNLKIHTGALIYNLRHRVPRQCLASCGGFCRLEGCLSCGRNKFKQWKVNTRSARWHSCSPSSALEFFSTKARKAGLLAVAEDRLRLGYQEYVGARIDKNMASRCARGLQEEQWRREWRRAACTCTFTYARTVGKWAASVGLGSVKENELRVTEALSKLVTTRRQ